jgi:hypothetical protein
MQHSKLKYGVIIVLIACSSCQKVIDLKLNNSATQLVIEANITDQLEVQYITVSQSIPFTNTNTFPGVDGAQIAVSDSSGRTHKFFEIEPGVYASSPFYGVYGATYQLNVKVSATVYTAKSTMPYPVKLDSISAKNNAFDKKNGRTIVVNYKDPPNIANQYRFVLLVNSGQVSDVFANNDSFSDGRYVKMELFQSATTIKSRDTVSVEMQSIDKNVYKYWFSLAQQAGNGPGGATSPANPPSNINNNALGYFSAHTTQTKSIIVY